MSDSNDKDLLIGNGIIEWVSQAAFERNGIRDELNQLKKELHDELAKIHLRIDEVCSKEDEDSSPTFQVVHWLTDPILGDRFTIGAFLHDKESVTFIPVSPLPSEYQVGVKTASAILDSVELLMSNNGKQFPPLSPYVKKTKFKRCPVSSDEAEWWLIKLLKKDQYR